MEVLFVCTGNICRSPTAERLASLYCAPDQMAGHGFSSAGTRAVVGSSIHDDASAVLALMGADTDNFSARQVSAKLALKADLVLAMTVAQRNEILGLAPQRLHRTFTLLEAAHLGSDHGDRTVDDFLVARAYLDPLATLDVADPIGRERRAFEEATAVIADALSFVLPLLR